MQLHATSKERMNFQRTANAGYESGAVMGGTVIFGRL